MKLFKRVIKIEPFSLSATKEINFDIPIPLVNKEISDCFTIEIYLEKTKTNNWAVIISNLERDVFYIKPFNKKKEALEYFNKLVNDYSFFLEEQLNYVNFMQGNEFNARGHDVDEEFYNFDLTEDELTTLSLLKDEVVNVETVNSVNRHDLEQFYYFSGYINCLRTSMLRKREINSSTKNNKEK